MEITIIQALMIVAVGGLILIELKPQILRRFFGKHKVDIGDSFWHFRGINGVRYENEKLSDITPTPFGSYNVHLKSGIVLPNVNIDERSPDCNIKIVKTVSLVGGVVDVHCNIDAMGKSCEWDEMFNKNYAETFALAKDKARTEVKYELLTNKEYNEVNETGTQF